MLLDDGALLRYMSFAIGGDSRAVVSAYKGQDFDWFKFSFHMARILTLAV